MSTHRVVTVRMPDELHALLQDCATDTKKSMNWLCVRAIENLIKQHANVGVAEQPSESLECAASSRG